VTTPTQERVQCSEAQAERAIKVLEEMIRAARAGNQAGENAVVAAAHGLKTLEALHNVSGYMDTPISRRRHMGDAFFEDVLRSVRVAIETAEGRSDA